MGRWFEAKSCLINIQSVYFCGLIVVMDQDLKQMKRIGIQRVIAFPGLQFNKSKYDCADNLEYGTVGITD